MYLAEDRILCFEIVTKKREAWVLRCVPASLLVSSQRVLTPMGERTGSSRARKRVPTYRACSRFPLQSRHAADLRFNAYSDSVAECAPHPASPNSSRTDASRAVISQRRRWMNGAFFAALYATTHYYRVWTSGQNVFRCMWLSIIFLYNAITVRASDLRHREAKN